MENFIFCAVYARVSEYTKVLNVPLVLNIAEFWIHQGSECVSGSEYARVRNMPGLHRAWICFDRPEWFLNMPNMPEYVWIYLKLTEFLFMCLSPFKSFVYLNAWLLISMKFILWRNEAIFLKRKYLIFSTVAGCIWFTFCLKLKFFTSKISNFLLPLGAEGVQGPGLGSVNLD